jgi:biopolymer transport protein ExbD
MKFEMKHKPVSLFSIISMLNIILLFFSFLLLTSYTLKSTNGSFVKNNPSVKNKNTISNNSTITLTEHDLIFLGTEEVSLPDLPERLKEESQKHNITMNLIAEKATRVDFIQEVIDIAKSSGIENLAIQTEMIKLNAAH